MKRKRKNYSANERVAILQSYLVDKVSVSDLCDEYLLNPTVFYRWQKDFSENGAAAFEKSNARRQRGERKHVEELLRLNGLKPASAIHPGQKLLVGSSRAINLFVHQTPASLAIRILRQTDPFKKQEISKAPSSHLPTNAVAFTDSDSRLVAIARIKHLSRVAEKISYRLIDALFKEVQAEANRLAGQRAAAAGAELIDFISSTTAMHTDFFEAEVTVAHRFQDGNVHIDRQALTINDIIGFKIIGSSQMLDYLTQALYDEPGITVIEREKHSGDYNAVNLLLDLDLPSTSVLTGHMQTIDWSIGLRRGLSPEYLRRNVAEYVNQGAKSIRIEIILTTYEELMEAEFGRSIHELRVLRLRHRQTYAGPLGQNAGYLIEYLLALASSPTVSIPEIPIKMYGRYLPEAIATLKCALYGTDIDGGLLSTFCPEQDCLRHFRTTGGE